jgi:hypothetical protein
VPGALLACFAVSQGDCGCPFTPDASSKQAVFPAPERYPESPKVISSAR